MFSDRPPGNTLAAFDRVQDKSAMRIRFYEIGERSFRWRSARSWDAGETCIEDYQYTDCERAQSRP